MPSKAIDLAVAAGIDPAKKQHEDACELYDYLVQYISNLTRSQRLNHYLQAQLLSFTTCQLCGKHEGETTDLSYLKVKVPSTKNTLSLVNLLWEQCTGHYSTKQEHRECGGCIAKGKTTPGYHETTFFQKCPIILAVLLNRTEIDNSAFCSAPVRIPYEIDVSDLAVQFERAEMCHYELFSIITLIARHVYRGHYAVTLVDGNEAYEFNDRTLTKFDTDFILSDRSVMSSSYMAFFVNKLSINKTAKPQMLGKLSNAEMKKVEALWFEDDIPSGGNLTSHDMQTCWNTELMNDEIVCALIRTVSTRSKLLKVHVTSSHLLKDIENGNFTNLYRNAVNEDLLLNELIVIPMHNEGAIGHWTVAGIFLNEKIVIVLDSMHNRNQRKFNIIVCYLKTLYRYNKLPFQLSSWLLISPTDVPKQIDNVHCGVYACINALSLVNLQLYSFYPCHINKLRYYIVTMANTEQIKIPSRNKKIKGLQVEKPIFTTLPIRNQLSRSICANSIESIRMLVERRREAVQDHSSQSLNDSDDQSQCNDSDDDADVGSSKVQQEKFNSGDCKDSHKDTKSMFSKMIATGRPVTIKNPSDSLPKAGSLSNVMERMIDAMETSTSEEDSGDENNLKTDEFQNKETDEKTKEEFIRCIEKNKGFIIDRLENAFRGRQNALFLPERLSALKKLSIKLFIECAVFESRNFIRLHGEETYWEYLSFLMKL